MDTSDAISGLLFIAALAFALLIADRYIRISRYIEPFQGAVNSQCGVDMTPCDFPLQCVNGYCRSVSPPRLPVDTGLPVYPMN
jgi:hypothetical protein